MPFIGYSINGILTKGVENAIILKQSQTVKTCQKQ